MLEEKLGHSLPPGWSIMYLLRGVITSFYDIRTYILNLPDLLYWVMTGEIRKNSQNTTGYASTMDTLSLIP